MFSRTRLGGLRYFRFFHKGIFSATPRENVVGILVVERFHNLPDKRAVENLFFHQQVNYIGRAFFRHLVIFLILILSEHSL